MKYYENFSCEQKEKIDSGKINTIETFKGGKYSDEIRQVYYEMLCGNVSVRNCGDLLKKKIKIANIDVESVPGKSLTAEMLAEMEILSKVHVHEEVMEGCTNVLHTDGTKGKFNEIGGFQVSAGSGSFTLCIEPMQSGESETYFSTFKLMTDQTIMNSSFFKKFQHWREQIIPFVVENFRMLPNAEKEKISNMHHVFCG